MRAAGARDGQVTGGFKLFDLSRDAGGRDPRPFGEPGDRRPALAVVIGMIGQGSTQFRAEPAIQGLQPRGRLVSGVGAPGRSKERNFSGGAR